MPGGKGGERTREGLMRPCPCPWAECSYLGVGWRQGMYAKT